MQATSGFTAERTQPELELLIEQTLRRLRISGKLKGYAYLTYMIGETVKNPRRTELITKDLYPETAARFGSEYRRVERAVRHAIRFSWNAGGGEELSQLAGYPLDRPPSNSEFIDIVAFGVRSQTR